MDDDESAREALTGLVRSAGFQAEAFASAREFLSKPPARRPGCLILDVDLPELSGLALQRQLKGQSFDVPIIFVTGHGDIPMSVQAIKAGAMDFFTKPFDSEALLSSIQRAIAERDQLGSGPDAVSSDEPSCKGIVGTSHTLAHVLRQVRTVAGADSTVLILGETGTGKELIARAIHDHSQRSAGPFVKVNCAALPPGLLESELMGHEKGAFTGAVAQRIGRFELAQGGTIFLDEIGELPLDLQPKLLRLLQEREFERVGGTRTLRADVRVVAATHRDLPQMVHERTFREDLYYRLSVFPIAIPALRDRSEDIPLLVQHFLRTISARMGKSPPSVRVATLARLCQYDWPGNIRELQNVVERAVILGEEPTVDLAPRRWPAAPEIKALPPRREDVAPPGGEPQSDALAEFSRAHIVRVLEATNWVIAGPNGAAARLQMKRSTLNFRMKKLNICRPERRAIGV
ncbi:Formate hydrogenlyase transcriptional activator [Minicystis rosea]|nr:Formate hydrogenlyase transcriptional activator [Minicystis rosea]